MSITSTAQAMQKVSVEVYQGMAPALECPNHAYTGGKPEFAERPDVFISKADQELLNPFLKDVCKAIRSRSGGYASSQAVFNEANRRVKITMQIAAGLKDSADGKRLSAPEVQTIRNPYVRMMVENAVKTEAPTDDFTDSSDSSSTPHYGSSSGSSGTGHGPHYYDDMPVDGPVNDGNSYWGPDGPNRGQDAGWGPDGPNRSGGSSWDGCGGGGGYIGGYPLF